VPFIITVPIYIERTHDRTRNHHHFTVKPLFVERPKLTSSNAKLEKAISDLTMKTYKVIHELPIEDQTFWSYNPRAKLHNFKLIIRLKRKYTPCRIPIVAIQAFGRVAAFSPHQPELWFFADKGERLKDRAQQVFTQFFSKHEDITPASLHLQGRAWLSSIDLKLKSKPKTKKPKEDTPMAFFGADSMSFKGEQELLDIGSCLERDYPEQLSRTLYRDDEYQVLEHLLQAPDQRPIVLIGPSGCGKTALIHEFAYRRAERRKDAPFDWRNKTWHISPQRLIAGMHYLGQWEARFLAIIRAIKSSQSILFFSDVPGLFTAGASTHSDECMAQLLKVEREVAPFRILAECTSEAFHIIQEKDRAFADMFHILRLEALDIPDTRQLLIHLLGDLERDHDCIIDPDVLPAVLDITGRYVPHQSFPGKAVDFLSRLAVKFRQRVITPELVYEEFQFKTGLSLSFTAGENSLLRKDIEEELEKTVIGQAEAIHAVTDCISLIRARLNDPEKPLGSFLFLGPTGVGKTQCAKAVAQYLFGSEEHLLRFDMNEFKDEASVMRLSGTFYRAEGLLTNAVLTQPYAVILFDEIEKAHPNVFDLLLQVLGEGRLTDALGRTVCFNNTIIIMTSNLGVREARSQLGFSSNQGISNQVFTKAAEQFFRPEFYNRIDRIVPFGILSREHLQEIVQLLLSQVLSREGLIQRKTILDISSSLTSQLVAKGYEPMLGARALKRTVEAELCQSTGRMLSGIKVNCPQIVRFSQDESGDIDVFAEELQDAKPMDAPLLRLSYAQPLPIIKQAFACQKRLTTELSARKFDSPNNTDVTFSLKCILSEQLFDLRNRLLDLEEIHSGNLSVNMSRSFANLAQTSRISASGSGCYKTPSLSELTAAEDMHLFLKDLYELASVPAGVQNEPLFAIIQELTLLDYIIQVPREEHHQTVLQFTLPLPVISPWKWNYVDALTHPARVFWHGSCYERKLDEQYSDELWISRITGPGAANLLCPHQGTILIIGSTGQLQLFRTHFEPIAQGQDTKPLIDNARDWISSRFKANTPLSSDNHELFAHKEVIRIMDGDVLLEPRFGLVVKTEPDPYRMLLMLPFSPPLEFDAFIEPEADAHSSQKENNP